MANFNGIKAHFGDLRPQSRVLVAPLDWGLGHATRCIPIIAALLEAGHQVWLAGEGAQEQLLRARFPALPFLPLQGYRVRYGRTAAGTLQRLIFQLPRIKKRIRAEQQWLAHMQAQHQWDLIISDNRYGLHHPSVKCVLITHQLWIIHPWGRRASQWLQRWNYRQLEKFSECWVPDLPEAPGLGGLLSHPTRMPAIPVRYIGPLSRLAPADAPVIPGHLFISLSGPEPQRTILENKLIHQIAHYPGSACLVRGLPGSRNLIPSTGSLQFYNHLPDDQYAAEMAKAEWVICRSGYSTLMDLQVLEKKAILIPTPGQTEQQYLAGLQEEQKKGCCIQQDEFELNAAIRRVKEWVGE